MGSVGGKKDKLSTRKLNRMARARGFATAKQMYVQMMAAQSRKMVEQQAQHPDKVGSLEAALEAA